MGKRQTFFKKNPFYRNYFLNYFICTYEVVEFILLKSCELLLFIVTELLTRT